MYPTASRRQAPLRLLALILAATLAGLASGQETCDGRLIDHAMGTTCVPEKPERVVVLDTGELDSALALGVVPVGAVTAFANGGFPSYLEGRTDGIAVVGTIAEPNLEAILALDPDLILSSKLRHESIYRQLSGIAPTVFTEAVGVVWKENLLANGEALGLREGAERLLADYDQRLATLRSDLDELPSVSIVRFLPGQVRIYLAESFIGTIIEDAGLPRPPAQRADGFALFVDKEGIALMDADVMFVTTYGPEEDTSVAEFGDDPLWRTLDVVRRGDVHSVPDAYWMLGIGPLAADLVINDLFSYLTDSGHAGGSAAGNGSR
ncbi:MAG: iron-siderophore ABC transporter substrate-binding protein [Trueperaceae bacterium]